jgi:chromosome partitioning protein
MPATTIAVFTNKGGEGKTTLAVNAGAVAARAAHHGVCTRDLRTLIVEFDAQGNSSSGLGIVRDPPRIDKNAPPARTIGSVLAGEIATEDAILPTYLAGGEGRGRLDILSADLNLADIEAKMETDPYAIDRLAMALANVQQAYDLILVDCHPGLGWLFRIAMRAAHAYVIPSRLERFSLDGLGNCMDQMQLHRPVYGLNATLLGIALLGVDYRLHRHTQVEKDVRATYGTGVFAALVRQNEPVAQAPFEGQAMVDFRPACRGSAGLREVTREMLLRAARRGLFDPSLVLPAPPVQGA